MLLGYKIYTTLSCVTECTTFIATKAHAYGH